LLAWIIEHFLPFILLISAIVFVHEWGHFWVARRNGVKVVHFAIGFGKELFGFTDSKGTRWGFHLVPLGGYVQMLGDADATSATADKDILENLSDSDKNQTLHSKKPWQRILVAAGGPGANFVFAILGMIFLFYFYGQPVTQPIIAQLDPKGLAAKSGLLANDEVVSINGSKISKFEEMIPFIRSEKYDSLDFEIKREDKTLKIEIPLYIQDEITKEKKRVKVIGIKPGAQTFEKMSLPLAFKEAFVSFYQLSKIIVIGLSEMLTGQRKGDEIGGILAIGDMASQSAKLGLAGMLWFMIVMSVNLGLINLFPIPVLDGGQILMNSVEWAIGRPISEFVQKVVYGAGFAMVIMLMLYSTWNDLMRYQVFQIIKGWLS
jgi:regulator of sigma E protease